MSASVIVSGARFEVNQHNFQLFDSFLCEQMELGQARKNDGTWEIEGDPEMFRICLKILENGKEAAPLMDSVRKEVAKAAKSFKLGYVENVMKGLKNQRDAFHEKFEKFSAIVFNFSNMEQTIEKAILIEKPSLFQKVFFSETSPLDSMNRFWIAGPTRYLDLLVKYYQGEEVDMPLDKKSLLELKKDSEFYGMTDVGMECKRALDRLERKKIPTETTRGCLSWTDDAGKVWIRSIGHLKRKGSPIDEYSSDC